MEWYEWEPFYEEILREFGFSREKEWKAVNVAIKIAKSTISVGELKDIIENRIVSVCGAGENLENEMGRMEGIIIAADEATTILLNHKIIPHIITTDLDGNIGDIMKANEKGSIVIIHAHGDNIEALMKYLPSFPGKIMLTTQMEPFNGIYNFGGFTDGDRAYCIASHFGAKKIKLIGFDFEKPREKKGKNAEIKIKKLQWAKKIIEYERIKKLKK